MYALVTAGDRLKFAAGNDAAEQFLRNAPEAVSRWTFAQGTYLATAYLWRRDLVLLAQSMPLPKHVVGADLFPHDVMYWTVDSQLRMPTTAPYSDAQVQSFLIVRTKVAYMFCKFLEVEHKADPGLQVVLDVEIVPMGARYPDDLRNGSAELMLKLAAFINSPFVRVDNVRAHTSKQARRRYGPRIGDPVALNVVTLRAEVREAVRVEAGDGPRWKQRWIVRGHYRAQWYPSTKSHKVIWVAPYLKGPDNAPIKQPIYAVVR